MQRNDWRGRVQRIGEKTTKRQAQAQERLQAQAQAKAAAASNRFLMKEMYRERASTRICGGGASGGPS